MAGSHKVMQTLLAAWSSSYRESIVSLIRCLAGGEGVYSRQLLSVRVAASTEMFVWGMGTPQ